MIAIAEALNILVDLFSQEAVYNESEYIVEWYIRTIYEEYILKQMIKNKRIYVTT